MAEALVQTADGEFLAMDPTSAAHIVESAAEQVEYGDRRRRPAGAAVLGARAPAPAPAVRAAAPAARGLLVQRDRPGYRGGDNWRDRARPWRSPRRQETHMEASTSNGSDDVKTFRGRSLEELLPQIRAELGPDAIVLRRREGLGGGVGGFFQRPYVEVDARAPHADERPLEIRSRPRDGRGPVLTGRAGAVRAGDAVRRRARRRRARHADGGRHVLAPRSSRRSYRAGARARAATSRRSSAAAPGSTARSRTSSAIARRATPRAEPEPGARARSRRSRRSRRDADGPDAARRPPTPPRTADRRRAEPGARRRRRRRGRRARAARSPRRAT